MRLQQFQTPGGLPADPAGEHIEFQEDLGIRGAALKGPVHGRDGGGGIVLLVEEAQGEVAVGGLEIGFRFGAAAPHLMGPLEGTMSIAEAAELIGSHGGGLGHFTHGGQNGGHFELIGEGAAGRASFGAAQGIPGLPGFPPAMMVEGLEVQNEGLGVSAVQKALGARCGGLTRGGGRFIEVPIDECEGLIDEPGVAVGEKDFQKKVRFGEQGPGPFAGRGA